MNFTRLLRCNRTAMQGSIVLSCGRSVPRLKEYHQAKDDQTATPNAVVRRRFFLTPLVCRRGGRTNSSRTWSWSLGNFSQIRGEGPMAKDMENQETLDALLVFFERSNAIIDHIRMRVAERDEK